MELMLLWIALIEPDDETSLLNDSLGLKNLINDCKFILFFRNLPLSTHDVYIVLIKLTNKKSKSSLD